MKLIVFFEGVRIKDTQGKTRIYSAFFYMRKGKQVYAADGCTVAVKKVATRKHLIQVFSPTGRLVYSTYVENSRHYLHHVGEDARNRVLWGGVSYSESARWYKVAEIRSYEAAVLPLLDK